jgi:long-chain acyl-CoA synthetase
VTSALPESIEAERADIARVVGTGNVCSRFLETVARQPDEVALRQRSAAGWTDISWSTYADRAAGAAVGLTELGAGRGDRVALFLRNRPEFHYFDTGSMLAGATPLSLYNSAPPEQLRFALGHSKAKVAICEDDEFARRVLAVRHDLPDLRNIVVVAPSELHGVHAASDVLTADPLDAAAAAARIDQSSLATVIYTSGTTGTPKGVMLSHRNVAFGAAMMGRTAGIGLRGARTVSYLPMAHIAERMCTHYQHLCSGTVVTTCENILDIGRYLVDVRPNWWFCAPRMWEKLHGAIELTLARDADLRERFEQARAVGARRSGAGESADPGLRDDWARVRREVIEPVLAGVGLDAVEVAITGSAPRPRHVLD